MNNRPRFFYLTLVATFLVSAFPLQLWSDSAQNQVREPAVAGLFYPKEPAALSRAVEACVSGDKPETKGKLRALIAPHAGYPYSGPVAGKAYRLLIGRSYSTVIVMGPSHYALLDAASITGARVFRTPLGDVPISDKAEVLGKRSPFQINAPAQVERPEWWQQSSRPPPARGEEYADTWEHSVEVEIPFLQKTLKTFSLVPVVVGEIDPTRAAHSLETVLDDDTLVVASSDLSHYHPYADAQALDRRCVDTILNLDTKKILTQEACGRMPIAILLQVAKDRGWTPQLLDSRNSGDTSGEKRSVVGYTAIGFFSNDSVAANSGPRATFASESTPSDYTLDDERVLLSLARDAVKAAASGKPLPELPPSKTKPELLVKKGCFVTLNEGGSLRGCIGHILPDGPLARGIAECARSAALEDPRFPPVKPREVDRLEIEISVLTVPAPLSFDSPEDLLKKLVPHKDGVLLAMGGKVATYLPQVWDELPDKVEFMDSLAEKAGASRGDWRKPGAVVQIYHVQSFSEHDLEKRGLHREL